MGHMVSAPLPSRDFWSGKRVFITGHTGFKGGWLALWLSKIGAAVHGYALPPDTDPNFFALCRIETKLLHREADVRDAAALAKAIHDFQPDIVFHLAAQALVRTSYAQPLETYATNIMGTAFLLDAVARTPNVQLAVIVTSDKIYAEGADAHTEEAPLGGKDPYSASKAGAELIAASFPASVKITTLRAGNVIGGGDWSSDRLVPDFFRAAFAHNVLHIRNPRAIRPWQHVLDALCGYLLAAEHMWHGTVRRDAWNFGPGAASEASVEAVITRLGAFWSGSCYEVSSQADAPHEAPILRLNAQKAQQELAWRPRWPLEEALTYTAEWYRAWQGGAAMDAISLSQIETYCQYD
ncbi:CDP-glucose 4,6-dehydratase [Acidocella sp.]|uniref:CDP-glucose 4,6-dehydratase n=1 Tax=Acidocella sp. TaxID=50710 RepID=UPI003D08E669